MRIVYVYHGPRDPARERDVAAFVASRAAGVRQVESHSGEDGFTTVVLELEGDRPVQPIAEALRARGDLTDAVTESFGEGA